MAAAGRGGRSDVGQRSRDEILAVQSRNNCKVWGRRQLSLMHHRSTDGNGDALYLLQLLCCKPNCLARLMFPDSGGHDGGVASEVAQQHQP